MYTAFEKILVTSQKEILILHAKGNINMQADNGIQIKSIGTDGIKVEATAGDYDLSQSDFKFEAGILLKPYCRQL